MHIHVRTYTGTEQRTVVGRFTRLSHLRHVSISRLSSVRALHENMGQAAVAYLQPRSSATLRSSGHDPRSVSSTIDQLKNRLSSQAAKNSRMDKSIRKFHSIIVIKTIKEQFMLESEINLNFFYYKFLSY